MSSRARPGVFARIIIFLIQLYRWTISPLLPAACRFEPTCSRYAQEAIEKHGLVRGVALAIKRIFRCHPGNAGGFDPVP